MAVHPDFRQQGPGFEANSLQAFVDNLSILDDYSATFHLVGNQLGEWHNKIYTGETWCVASHIYDKDGVQRKLDMGVRYQDIIELANTTFFALGEYTLEESFYWRGLAHEALGKMNEAVFDLKKAVELNPRFTPAREELARLGVEIS